MNSTTSVVRVNFTLPRELFSELKKEVSKRGKSNFVAEAIEEKLANKRKAKAFKELAKLPPTFVKIKDGAKYIAEERIREDVDRSKRLRT